MKGFTDEEILLLQTSIESTIRTYEKQIVDAFELSDSDENKQKIIDGSEELVLKYKMLLKRIKTV